MAQGDVVSLPEMKLSLRVSTLVVFSLSIRTLLRENTLILPSYSNYKVCDNLGLNTK